MKKHISLRKLPSVLFMAVMFGTVFGFALGFNPLPFICGLIGLAFIPAQFLPLGAFGMAIQKEIWTSDIAGSIFPDDSFMSKSVDASEYVVGTVVHKPQAGAPGNVVKNRSSFPASIGTRTDTINDYSIAEYTTDPIRISNADTVELTYDKRNSILMEEKLNLNLRVAKEMLYNWLFGINTSFIIPTTGAAVTATAPGATGTRKAALITDLQTARTALHAQGRWVDGQMYALIPSNMVPQLFPADSVVTATYMGLVSEEERRNGIIAKVQGFNIMERSSGAIYTGTTLAAVNAAGAATDCEAIVCWYAQSVERALGDVIAFENIGDPTFYGDIYSFLVRAGGSRSRTDGKGLVVIRQAIVS
jgi:hypothetical protein